MRKMKTINAMDAALYSVIAYGNAATLSLDRYGGAAAARDLQWASIQAAAVNHYSRLMGSALITYADRIDALVQLVHTEGVTDIIITANEIRAYQQRLGTTGFSPTEIADARAAGLTDAEIEAVRQAELAADPEANAGSLIDYLTELAQTSRELAAVLLRPTGPSLANQPNGITLPPSHNLTRVYNTMSSFAVGNPLTQTAAIELRVRPVDVPPDWIVSVTPIEVTLAPGEQTTATLTIAAGAAVPQGIVPRVAVEGYAGTQLIGGIAFDGVVPHEVPFDGRFRVYLPVAIR